MPKEITAAMRRALLALAQAEYMLPSDIGYAVTEGRRAFPMKGQGAGRLGGSIAKRLIEMGLAEDCSFKRDGFPAYRITGAGRRAVEGITS